MSKFVSKSYSLLILFATIMTAVLFSTVAATAQTYTPLFTYPNGSRNNSGIGWPQLMAQGRDGSLYSTDADEGTPGQGLIYKMSTGGQFTNLYIFCPQAGCADGAVPEGGLTLGFDGNFYGTTAGGGQGGAGTVFKVTPTGAISTLHLFTNGTDDSAPAFALTQGQDGNLYGVSAEQYNGQNGALFKVSAKGVFTVTHDFVYTDGSSPNLPIQGTDGFFYGTAQFGGDPTCKCGVVYKATAAGHVTVLHAFKGYPADGYRPLAMLAQGNDGNFYGTTYQGGANNKGAVFKISPSGAFTLLYSFGAFTGDGVLPIAGLTLGTDGNFYGSASAGGTKNAGEIFKMTPVGKETVLYNFCAVTCTDGFGPATNLMLHTNGKFYGNTNGNSLGGSVFYSLDVGLKPLVDLVTWSAKVGKTVEILGQGFNGTTSVLFNGVPATFNNSSDTYMTATVPAGALSGLVTVKTFTATMTSNRAFLVTPQIKSFSPASGAVGTSVTITGISLKQASKLLIGGKAASFAVNSDTQVTAIVPAGAKTGKKITITTTGGIANSPTNFVVVPSISSFTPASGPVGTSVAIKGNSFSGTSKVTFGGVAATSYQVISDTEVDALVPAGAITGAIAVTTPGGTGTSSTNFTVTH